MFEKLATALKELDIFGSVSYNRWDNTYEFRFLRNTFGGSYNWRLTASPKDLDRDGYFDELIRKVKSHLSDEYILENIKRATT